MTSAGNVFFANTAGICVLSGTLNSSNDTIGSSSASGNVVGALVSGGAATFGGDATSPDTIYGNTTGIQVLGGTATLHYNNFFLTGSGNTNSTDLEVDGGAGTVTIGANNAFHASQYYINNQSAQSFDLSNNGATFNGAAFTFGTSNPYSIEDKIVDGIDVPGLGLVRIAAGKVFVTPNSFYAPATFAP